MASDARDPRGGSGGASIPVAVRNVNGELLELEAEPDCTVYGLKCRIAEYWQVAPTCQKLTHKTEALKDSSPLVELWEDPQRGDALTLTLGIMHEEVYKCIELEDPAMRRMGIQTLGQIAHKDFERAMVALAQGLNDPDWEVRRAAVDMLGEVAPRGDENAIGACQAHLEDRSVSVRHASILALGQLSPKGDANTIKVIADLLEDRDDGVRRAVAEALSELAPRGHPVTMELVTERLEHWSVLVRRAAIETLARVAEKGDEKVIVTIADFLRQEPGLLRVAAVFAIGQLGQGGKAATSIAMAALEDPDERVQAAAAQVLREAGLAPLDGPSTKGKSDMAPSSVPEHRQREELLKEPLGDSTVPIRRTASN